VVVRPIGVDLYLGWTMWRSRSTVVLIGHLLRDTFQGTGLSTGFSSEMRATASRALRELVHSVTREGVQAAILPPPVADDRVRADTDQLRDIATAAATPSTSGTRSA
jgi:hypothetical protein